MTSFSVNWLINSFWCITYVLLLLNLNVLPQDVKESLPFCDLAQPSNYIFVSTLDGKLTALNPDAGSVVWSVQLGTESMLSCSIHKLELTNYGHLVRMIPSLSGALYKFNGESIEAVPVTVEQLLQSSFKYSDDLVISGGKESQTFGVSLHSGKVLYECSLKGCENAPKANDVGDILVIQRLGQTVRAVEPRTGSERWNFSVAQHDLKLLSECHDKHLNEPNLQLKVIVPEGLIYAIDGEDKTNIVWQYRFGSPIIGAWQIRKGKLSVIDLFSGFQPTNLDMVISPSLYVGMHEKQLYIQESVLMQRKRQEITYRIGQNLISNDNNELSIPWKPISASRNFGGFLTGTSDQNLDENIQRETTALSVLYASSYIEGSGFYLYCDDGTNQLENPPTQLTLADDRILALPGSSRENLDEAIPVQMIASLWYWWREVVVISMTTALLFNVMFTRRFLSRRPEEPEIAIETANTALPVKNSDSGIDVVALKKESESSLQQEFTSRYLTDFEPINCLGKGGFGVVFEAKNKIDECRYAIKRIVLPVSQDSRDRVMREVKALAKLDHRHIVRYFNAWTECPPPGWQDNHDKLWIDSSMDMSSGLLTSTSTQTNNVPTAASNGNPNAFVCINWSHLKSDKFSYTSNDNNDSFIQFVDEMVSDGGSGKLLPKVKHGSVLNKESTQSESLIVFKGGKQSNRPNTLQFSERACGSTCNPTVVYLYIQMQLCQRQSLRDWLTSNMEREYSRVLRIFEQILQAVEHVHLHGLIHRDLKPSNIFFSLENEIKVGDFGLVTAMTEGDAPMSPCDCSKSMDKERHTAQVGTQLYMSPEQLSGENYSYKVDIYSLGLILFELLVPFNTQMERITVLENIKKDKFSKDFIAKYKTEYDLLRMMLSHSPDERPTTYGVRAMLLEQNTKDEGEEWHFNLPKRRRISSKTSSTSTSSSESLPE